MVKILEEDSKYQLERQIADIIKEGHVIKHISHAVSKHGYTDYYSCILITDEPNK